jgi:hypothetical protein
LALHLRQQFEHDGPSLHLLLLADFGASTLLFHVFLSLPSDQLDGQTYRRCTSGGRRSPRSIIVTSSSTPAQPSPLGKLIEVIKSGRNQKGRLLEHSARDRELLRAIWRATQNKTANSYVIEIAI